MLRAWWTLNSFVTWVCGLVWWDNSKPLHSCLRDIFSSWAGMQIKWFLYRPRYRGFSVKSAQLYVSTLELPSRKQISLVRNLSADPSILSNNVLITGRHLACRLRTEYVTKTAQNRNKTSATSSLNLLVVQFSKSGFGWWMIQQRSFASFAVKI